MPFVVQTQSDQMNGCCKYSNEKGVAQIFPKPLETGYLIRMLSNVSQGKGFDAFGRGLSDACPTDILYIPSGGQMAMKRA
jgi:hypothetical protein